MSDLHIVVMAIGFTMSVGSIFVLGSRTSLLFGLSKRASSLIGLLLATIVAFTLLILDPIREVILSLF